MGDLNDPSQNTRGKLASKMAPLNTEHEDHKKCFESDMMAGPERSMSQFFINFDKHIEEDSEGRLNYHSRLNCDNELDEM